MQGPYMPAESPVPYHKQMYEKIAQLTGRSVSSRIDLSLAKTAKRLLKSGHGADGSTFSSYQNRMIVKLSTWLQAQGL